MIIFLAELSARNEALRNFQFKSIGLVFCGSGCYRKFDMVAHPEASQVTIPNQSRQAFSLPACLILCLALIVFTKIEFDPRFYSSHLSLLVEELRKGFLYYLPIVFLLTLIVFKNSKQAVATASLFASAFIGFSWLPQIGEVFSPENNGLFYVSNCDSHEVKSFWEGIMKNKRLNNSN